MLLLKEENDQQQTFSPQKNTNSQKENYANFCRPAIAELLSAAGLDVEYHRAQGDHLYFYDEDGNERRITDFLGGYGSLLFGHNHPELLNIAISHLKSFRPFSAQASCRSAAAKLADLIQQMMKKRFDFDVISTFLNTGTEAVEAAIKHAEMAKQDHIKKTMGSINRTLNKTLDRIKKHEYTISEHFENKVRTKFPYFNFTSIENTLTFLQIENEKTCSTPPAYISLINSFHGKTSGAVQLTHNLKYRGEFERIGFNTKFVHAENTQELDQCLCEHSIELYELDIQGNTVCGLKSRSVSNISAMFVEPIQGEGGVNILSDQYLQYCRTIADKCHFHLVFDEIQSGMGRTGHFLYSEKSGVKADYYLLSKSLGGGLSKISALIINKRKYIHEFGLKHTSTFGEDDFSCTIALRALELIDKNSDIMQSCHEKGARIIEGLNKLKHQYPDIIADVRGAGLMIGIEFSRLTSHGSIILENVSRQGDLPLLITSYLFHTHRIRVAPTLSTTQVIRIEPSAYIDIVSIDEMIMAFARVCEILSKRNTFEMCRSLIRGHHYTEAKPIKNYRTEKEPGNSVVQNDEAIPKVGFIGHLIQEPHVRFIEPSFELFTDKELHDLISRFQYFLANSYYDEKVVSSVNGKRVALHFIGLLVTSEQIYKGLKERDTAFIEERIHEAVDYAANNQFVAIGFGGYTSIVMNNCKKVRRKDIALTTGNSLTVGIGLQAIYKKAEELKLNLDEICFACVGAAGNIGSVYSQMIAERIGKIILIGRHTSLNNVVSSIYSAALKKLLQHHATHGNEGSNEQGIHGIAKSIRSCETVHSLIKLEDPLDEFHSNSKYWINALKEEYDSKAKKDRPIQVTENLREIAKADLILSSSNSAQPLIYPDMLPKKKVILCDIAVPRDTCISVEKMKNVSLIKGGIVKLPLNPEFKVEGMPLPLGHTYACMSETLLMGLQGYRSNFSYGSLDKQQVKTIMQIAQHHDFRLGAEKNRSKLLTSKPMMLKAAERKKYGCRMQC